MAVKPDVPLSCWDVFGLALILLFGGMLFGMT